MKICSICGDPLPKWRRTYCSNKCYNTATKEWCRLNYLRNSSPRFCKVCGSRLPRYRHKYCSEDCKPKNHCVDCGIIIGNQSERCSGCAVRYGWKCGIYFSEERNEKISKSLKSQWDSGSRDGQNSTDEMRKKLSKAFKLKWADGHFDDRYTDEYSRNLSNAKKKNWVDGVYNDRKIVIDSPTSIEIIVSRSLNESGLKHQTQFRPDGYSRIYDELIYPNILVEIQGSYFHATSNVWKRDLEKARWAHQNGYKFITIWDYEIKEYGARFLVEKWILPLIPEGGFTRERA